MGSDHIDAEELARAQKLHGVVTRMKTKQEENALQLQTSWFVCRVGAQSRRVARAWLEWSVDARCLTTGEPSPGGEQPQFVVHRHDQAVLTNLLDALDQVKVQ